jgi:DNA-binding LytR/AlgR family response regulator
MRGDDKMKFVILENNEKDRLLLQSILNTWAIGKGIPCDTLCFSSGESFLHAKIYIDEISVFFLNIIMDSTTGMDIALFLRKNGFNGEIIFLANTTDYILQSYDVHAFNYILKPIDVSLISKNLDEIYSNSIGPYYLYQHKGDLTLLPYRNIICFISCRHNVDIVTTSNTYTERISFSEIITKLPTCFIQIHRSFIVNMGHISKISHNMIYLSNHMQLNIGRSYIKNVHERFTQFISDS